MSKQKKKQVNKKQSVSSAQPAREEKAQQGAPQPVLVAAALAVVQSIAVICFGIFLIVREATGAENESMVSDLSLIHISEPTRRLRGSRMPSSA